MVRFSEAPRPLRIACFVLASFAALGLIAAVALLVFGREQVITFTEDFALVDATILLPVVLGALLIWLAHRWIKGRIEG